MDDKIDELYYYMQYVKFGLEGLQRRKSNDTNNQMSREEGVELARKYDHEFPKTNIKDVLEYLGLNRNQFDEIVNKHKSGNLAI